MEIRNFGYIFNEESNQFGVSCVITLDINPMFGCNLSQ